MLQKSKMRHKMRYKNKTEANFYSWKVINISYNLSFVPSKLKLWFWIVSLPPKVENWVPFYKIVKRITLRSYMWKSQGSTVPVILNVSFCLQKAHSLEGEMRSINNCSTRHSPDKKVLEFKDESTFIGVKEDSLEHFH